MLYPEVTRVRKIDDKDNRFWEDLVNNLVKMINKTKFYIHSVSGELNSNVYDNDLVLEAFEDALQRSVNIKIISSNEIDRNSSRLIDKVLNKEIELYVLPDREVLHFRISDGKNVFIEEKHEPLQKENRKAAFIYNSATLRNKLKKQFDSLLEQATRVNEENFDELISYIN